MAKVKFTELLREYVVFGKLATSGKQFVKPERSPSKKELALTVSTKTYGNEPFFEPVKFVITKGFYLKAAEVINDHMTDPEKKQKSLMAPRYDDDPTPHFSWPYDYRDRKRRKLLMDDILQGKSPWSFIEMDESAYVEQFGEKSLSNLKADGSIAYSQLDRVLSSVWFDDIAKEAEKKGEPIEWNQLFWAKHKYEIEKKKKEDPNYKIAFGDFSDAFHFGGHGYLVIDHDAKEIYADEEDVKYSNRMAGYTTGDEDKKEPHYVTVKASFSLEDPEQIRKFIAALVKTFPQLAEYTYVDKINDGGKYTATDAMKRKPPGELGKVAQNRANFLAMKGPLTVYHGTSLERWEEIQKSGFMSAGKGANYIDKIRPHSDRLLYFTTDKNIARRYATRMARAGKAVVLEVTIDDLTKITFDEDNLNYQAAVKAEKAIGAEKFQAIAKQYKAWSDSFGYEHPGSIWKNILYRIDRNKKQVARIFDAPKGYGSPREFPEVERVEALRFVRLVTFYAIKIYGENGYSFGYVGKIPVNKIRQIEEFKGARYYDNKPSDEMQKLHQKAVDTWKRTDREEPKTKKKRAPKGPSSSDETGS